MSITHAFSSAKSDGADATLVRPSNWNAAHTVTDLAYAGYLRLGSASAPTNTTSGHLTAVAAFIPTINGSPTNASGGTLTLVSTTHATKGLINFGAAAVNYYDEANGFLRMSTINGSEAASGSLTLNSTSHATKGFIYFGANSAYDGNTIAWGIGTATPTSSVRLHLAKAGAASTDNWMLKLENTGANAADVRVGILLIHNTNYGIAMYSSNDGVTGAGNLSMGNFSGGAYTERWVYWYDGSVTFGAPTGSRKGSGTLNAVGVYDDNVLLTDHVFDAHLDGKLQASKYEGRLQPWVEKFDPAWLDTGNYAAYWRANRRLPLMHDSLESRGSLGEQVNALTLNMELLAIQVASLAGK